jgi:antagonist of KipI
LNRIEIEVLEPGLQTTFQDLGRSAGRRYGLPPGGALDRFAHQAANELAGNPAAAATLEITLQGPRLLFATPALISLTGADLGPLLNDRPVPMWMSVFVRAGQALAFTPRHLASGAGAGAKWGGRAYLAVHGGFEAPLNLDSRSTYLRARFGGIKGEGRVLQPGDRLFSNPPRLRSFSEAAGRLYPPQKRPAYGRSVTVRLVPGPYQEHFLPAAYSHLFGQPYRVTSDADRMGFRLEGPKLAHVSPEMAEIPACGAVFGAIQVPANGQPIILMADHQVTGGYPIIGTVLSADLPLVAQLLPGDEIRFSETR